MRKILITILSTWLILSVWLLIINCKNCTKTDELSIVEPQIIKEEPQVLAIRIIEEVDPLEEISNRMRQEMLEIETIENNKEWFLAYKDIVYRYSKWFDPPETVFDVFTEDEIKLICRAVETECYGQDFDSKTHVASVIFNRIEQGGEFGSSVKEVITKENQFAYWREEITEETILSVMYVYEIEDTTNGCIAFRSGEKPERWYTTETNYWVRQFIDNAGHGLYK